MKKLFATLPFVLIIGIYTACVFSKDDVDEELIKVLQQHEFDGKIQSQLTVKLGRPLDTAKVNLGKLIFFDNGLGLHQDNSCAGCHAPNFGFGDSQPIAIGVQNNHIVGLARSGPRNQRRTPTVINTAFYKTLMWNGRFASNSESPFDNSKGFAFPAPEGDSIFSQNTQYVKKIKHLLVAQAHIPFTEQPEMAGFTTSEKGNTFAAFSRFAPLIEENQKMVKTIQQPLVFKTQELKKKSLKLLESCKIPDFAVFNDGIGLTVPQGDPNLGGSANFKIREVVLTQINKLPIYREKFGEIYPSVESGGQITFLMIGEVLAEFQFSLTFAQAPIDEYAMGNKKALTDQEKKGALIFFTKGNCVSCHAVKGSSNQMFSDFNMYNVGVPQLFPTFGKKHGNVPFSTMECKAEDGEFDFGLADNSDGTPVDARFKFRSSPLRNLSLQSAFFHNGAFSTIDAAVAYHINPKKAILTYDPKSNRVPNDLSYKKENMNEVFKNLDSAFVNGISLSDDEVKDLVVFLKSGLTDKRANKSVLMGLVPKSVPSGASLPKFQ